LLFGTSASAIGTYSKLRILTAYVALNSNIAMNLKGVFERADRLFLSECSKIYVRVPPDSVTWGGQQRS
jgi:hypothetical protein